MSKKIRIGCGAGYAGDRIEPAVELMEKGNLDYIIFECLAERTIAIAQQDKLNNPKKGYNFLLEERIKKILPLVKKYKTKVITNMGAANPIAAVEESARICKSLGIKGIKFAAVTGDDIFKDIGKYEECSVLEKACPLKEISNHLISANIYCGAEGIIQALKNDADIIITGRVADPSLTIGPLVYEFGWNTEKNKEQMGQAVLAGHLLECGGQVTGGYFADPGYKDVPMLEQLGFPIVEIDEKGGFTISKVNGSGGMVTIETCKEQMLYEIHNPQNYITPDAIADFSSVSFSQIKKDVIKVKNATSHGKPELLKVNIAYKDCFIGEGEISYGGSNCLARAKLAAEIVRKRLKLIGAEIEEYREDFIGYNSLYKSAISNQYTSGEYPEVRLRCAGRTKARKDATLIANEVESLYTNGPAGGAGATKNIKEVIAVGSIFIPRNVVQFEIFYKEV